MGTRRHENSEPTSTIRAESTMSTRAILPGSQLPLCTEQLPPDSRGAWSMPVQTSQKVPPCPINRPKPRGGREGRRTRKLALLAAPLLFLGAGSTWLISPARHAQRADLLTQAVHFDKLQTSYTEHGVLAAAVNSDIICRVKARNHGSTVASTIKWVIDDGSPVHKGDVLVQLDDSGLQED